MVGRLGLMGLNWSRLFWGTKLLLMGENILGLTWWDFFCSGFVEGFTTSIKSL